MNIIQKTKQHTTISPLLSFSIGLFLLCNSFTALAVTYAIGDTGPGQGIVFFVSANGEHGLEAAPSDQSTSIQWYNGNYTVTNATKNGVNAGIFNTERIIINQGAGNYAAQLCANYHGGGYGDWYLPSKKELNLLYKQKDVVGGFFTGATDWTTNYWSSTESDRTGSHNAWIQTFGDGGQGFSTKYFAFRVRAIRAF